MKWKLYRIQMHTNKQTKIEKERRRDRSHDIWLRSDAFSVSFQSVLSCFPVWSQCFPQDPQTRRLSMAIGTFSCALFSSVQLRIFPSTILFGKFSAGSLQMLEAVAAVAARYATASVISKPFHLSQACNTFT